MKRPHARIFRGTERNLGILARKLRDGEIVGVPTETVYGLAANAFDPRACEKIFRAKKRPHYDPLIVHIYSFKDLHRICRCNGAAERLMRRFWPGPLTVVLPKTDLVPALVTAGQPSVAVRMPRHALFRRLLARAGVPLAAPSANPFGYISPTSAEHVRASLGKRIRYILDGGESKIGLESTIVDMRSPRRPRLLRPGAISKSQLEFELQCSVSEGGKPDSKQEGTQLAPGMLKRHYSPRTRVFLHRTMPREQVKGHAYLYMSKPVGPLRPNVFWLARRGSLDGAARQLFGTLRKLDAKRYTALHVQLADGGEMASAINDRLRRAASR